MASHASLTVLPGGRLPAPVTRQEQRLRGLGATAWQVLRWSAVVWLAVTLALCAVSVAPRLIGWTPSVVVTGSMRPAVQPGHVVLIDSAGGELAAGDIIVVPDPSHQGRWITHRIDEIRDDLSIVTKGDANQSADTFTTPIGDVIGKVVLVVPFAGRPALLWQRGAAVDYIYWALLVVAALVLTVPGRRRS